MYDGQAIRFGDRGFVAARHQAESRPRRHVGQGDPRGQVAAVDLAVRHLEIVVGIPESVGDFDPVVIPVETKFFRALDHVGEDAVHQPGTSPGQPGHHADDLRVHVEPLEYFVAVVNMADVGLVRLLIATLDRSGQFLLVRGQPAVQDRTHLGQVGFRNDSAQQQVTLQFEVPLFFLCQKGRLMRFRHSISPAPWLHMADALDPLQPRSSFHTSETM